MVPDFTLNALNPVTCVLSAIVLLLQSPVFFLAQYCFSSHMYSFCHSTASPVTCVLSATVLLLQSPQCMSLFLLLTLVSSPCDVKFSSFQTDETMFLSVGNRSSNKRVFFVQKSTTFRWISRYFGCRNIRMNGQWWCWWYVARLS
jgi:hypothetical protein